MALSADWTFNQLSKLHKQQPKLVDDALKQLINSNPELTWSLVVNAYLDREINLSKAAEMLDLHMLELREKFLELGIPIRHGATDLAEAKAEVEALDNWLSSC
ncbi:MAG: hypothetical protein AAF902_11145 [Chloroflexota bacterium]